MIPLIVILDGLFNSPNSDVSFCMNMCAECIRLMNDCVIILGSNGCFGLSSITSLGLFDFGFQ